MPELTYQSLVTEYGEDMVRSFASFECMGQSLTLVQLQMAIEAHITPDDPSWDYLLAMALEGEDDDDA